MSTPIKLHISEDYGFRWISSRLARSIRKSGAAYRLPTEPLIELQLKSEFVEKIAKVFGWSRVSDGRIMNGAMLQRVPRIEE